MIEIIKNKAKSRYDLPLHRGTGGHMLVWLISLMSYLAVISIVMILGLNSLTKHWTDGIEEKMTVEIPYNEKDKNREQTSQAILDIINDNIGLTATLIPEDEILDMIEPWFGDLTENKKTPLPIPILIDIQLDKNQPVNTKDILKDIQKIDKKAILNTHDDWLDDILSFSKVIQFVVFGIASVMILTAVIAVANAARIRLALHHDEVDLLHLIGASDHYIARQFQRQTMRLAFEGSLLGLFFGIFTLFVIRYIGPDLHEMLSFNFNLRFIHILFFLLIPFITIVMTMLISRITVMRVLKNLP